MKGMISKMTDLSVNRTIRVLLLNTSVKYYITYVHEAHVTKTNYDKRRGHYRFIQNVA